MNKKSFYISFFWKSEPRKLLIETQEPTNVEPVKSVYKVFLKENYLFSIYPTIGRNSSRIWNILEKDREVSVPEGFIAAVGILIDETEN